MHLRRTACAMQIALCDGTAYRSLSVRRLCGTRHQSDRHDEELPCASHRKLRSAVEARYGRVGRAPSISAKRFACSLSLATATAFGSLARQTARSAVGSCSDTRLIASRKPLPGRMEAQPCCSTVGTTWMCPIKEASSPRWSRASPNCCGVAAWNARFAPDSRPQGKLLFRIRGLARLRGSNVLHSPDREARNATRSPGSRARAGRTSEATSAALFNSGAVFPVRACRVRNAGTAHRDLVDCLSLIKYQEPITGDFHENARTSLV